MTDAVANTAESARFTKLLADLGIQSELQGRYAKERHSLEEICYMLDVAMPISVAILDEEMRYVFINSQTYRLFGLTDADIQVGCHLSEAHDAMTRKGLLDPKTVESSQISPSLLSHQKAGDADTRIMPLKDGRSMRLTRRKLGNGYTVSIAEDVSDLARTNHLLQEALILGTSGYWIYDFNSKTYSVSDSLYLLFDKTNVEHVINHGPLPAIHPEDRQAFRDAMKNMTKTGDRFEIKTRFAFLEKPLWFMSIGRIIRSADGKPSLLQCFVRNVTREHHDGRKVERAKDEAIAANIAKSQFLANMSHEIRTPMNGVLGMAELLAGSALDDRQREFVNVITRSATSLLTVINDILDFSKIEADALELEYAPFSLRDIIAETATLLSQKASEKGLELIVDYASGQPHSFVGDGVRVRQVLTNLVGNAVKFTETGHVLIKVTATPDPSGNAYIVIEVTDTGIGIEPDKVDSVFDKFTQADNSTTRIYGGTGLGLSISKRLAEMMGGTLAVRSVYGEGSTFTVSIPLPLDKSAKPIVRNTAPLKGKRALIIDDVDVNRRLISEQLTGWGMKTRAVADGVEALAVLKEASSTRAAERYDIAIMDYLMPGVNGRELAAMVHSQPAIDLPILMLSSCDESQDIDANSDAGIDRYLVKPVREQTLFDAVLDMIYTPGGRITSPAPQPEEPAAETSAPSRENTCNFAHRGYSTPPKIVMTAKELFDMRADRDGIEILVAEDFALNQDVVRLMLADTRYTPVIVENGDEAQRLYAQSPERFAAVLMDVSMPVMDGYTATNRIRSIEGHSNRRRTPIIALTGHALTHEREKCIQAGMDDYLTKPVKQVELIGALDRWTGNETRIAVA